MGNVKMNNTPSNISEQIIIYQGKDIYIKWITKGGRHVPIFGKSEKPWSKTRIKSWKKGSAERKKESQEPAGGFTQVSTTKQKVSGYNNAYHEFSYKKTGIKIYAENANDAGKIKPALDTLPTTAFGKVHKDFRGAEFVVASGSSRDHPITKGLLGGDTIGVYEYESKRIGIFKQFNERGTLKTKKLRNVTADEYKSIPLHEAAHYASKGKAPAGWSSSMNFDKNFPTPYAQKVGKSEDFADSFSLWKTGKLGKVKFKNRTKFLEKRYGKVK